MDSLVLGSWQRLAFVSDSAQDMAFFGTDWPSCPISQGG